MPSTRASNKNKHPGLCVRDAESDVEKNEKPKRKRRTKDEMVAFRAEKARVAQEEADNKAAREQERQIHLKKVAAIELQMQREDLNRAAHHNEARSSDSESQQLPKKKVKVGMKKGATTRPVPRRKEKKPDMTKYDEDEGEDYEPKTPAPPRKIAKKPVYVEVGDDSGSESLELKTPVPREKAGNNVRFSSSTKVDDHLNFTTPGPQRGTRAVAGSSAPDAIANRGGEVIPDSQTDEPDEKRKAKTSRQIIEEMKVEAMAWKRRGAKSETLKTSHERFNRWLTDYIRTPQDNTGIEERSVGSKQSVPSARSGGSKPLTSTAVESLTSNTDVALLDIIEIDDDSDVAPFEEDQKIERDAAHNSPPKHGKRVTSKSMVKVVRKDATLTKAKKPTIVKEEPQDDAVKLALATRPKPTSKPKPEVKVPVKTEPGVKREEGSNLASSDDESIKKKRERPTNDSSLPPALATNRRLWRSTVLPTLINYIGTLHNPWLISEDRLVAYLQPILDHFLPRTERYKIQPCDPILGLVTQRLNEWRSSFGSCAISVIDAFFGAPDTQADRQAFANEMLEDKAFLYAEPNKELPNGQVRSVGIFRGDLVLETFTAHIRAVTGAVSDIAGLEHPRRAVGALALAAVAAERALKLWQNGYLRVLPDGSSEIAKQINPATGKTSAKAHAFSNKYNDRTGSYSSLMTGTGALCPSRMIR